MSQSQRPYRSLTAERIVETLAVLERRIAERFPASGLRKVAGELHGISQEAINRSRRVRRPNLPMRAAISVLLIAIVALVVSIVSHLRVRDDLWQFENFVQSLEATLGSIVFIGAGILFLFTLELRWKRERALKALHELRALAHIIDMHQLTKDPERITGHGSHTQSSPQRTMTTFELGRYLDYCSEMLSLVSKIGALYVQEFPDAVVLEASDQLAMLTNALTRNIWQKIMIIDQMLGDEPHPKPVPTAGTSAPAGT